jgi:hypothetical protein
MRLSRPTLLLLAAGAAIGVPLAACSSATRGAGFTDDTSDAAASPGTDAGGAGPTTDTGTTAAKDAGSTVVEDTGVPVDTGVPCKTTPPSSKCGLAPQCGCTSTQTCEVLDLSGNVDCVAAGTADRGHACTGTGQCKQGLTCVGTCHPFCDTACTDPKSNVCLQIKNTGGVVIPNLKVCQMNCDLRDPMACGGTNPVGTAGCDVVDDKGNTDCVQVGNVALNGTCSASARCKPALVCITTGGVSRCRTWCRMGIAGDCTTGACGGLTPKLMVGTQEWGICP